ncbi:hypothetical protein [Phaffia rhodozyma]|uniref:Uncharacterized protein n=1 Tax=Phaffia rhodozyma TaxID=264483 RepID=A0A0F7SR78_PHARH|nr:hypothetical protein [Phaffia rhodozyma]
MSLNKSSPYTCPSKLVQIHSDYSRNSDSANEAFSMYRSSARARSNSLSSNAESFVSNGGSVSSSNSAAAPFVWMTVLRSRPGLAEELTTFLAGASQRILEKEPGVLFHRTLRCVDDEDDDVVGTKFLAYAE